MGAPADVGYHARQNARWRLSEIAFWLLALACAFLFPSRYLIMTDIVRLGLFALSLDLILGYAGIVSLAMRRSSASALIRPDCWRCMASITHPVLALVVAGFAAAVLGFLTSFLVIRGVDLTRLMVTLGIALLLEALAERFSDITGGTDGLQGIEMQPILGLFAFDMFGKIGFFYSLTVLFLLFLLARRIVHSPFGLSLRAIRNNPLRASAIGIPVNRRLIAVYTLAAFYAGIAGALFTQTTALASLDVFSFERSADLMLVLVIGGTGYLYGGLIGAVVFRMLQEVFSSITPKMPAPRAKRPPSILRRLTTTAERSTRAADMASRSSAVDASVCRSSTKGPWGIRYLPQAVRPKPSRKRPTPRVPPRIQGFQF